jgi:hypothetical protein
MLAVQTLTKLTRNEQQDNFRQTVFDILYKSEKETKPPSMPT